jgi:hypothetical protein
MKFLALPAARFNFFGYMLGDGAITLDGQVQSNNIRGGFPDNGDIAGTELGTSTITALRELGGLSSGGGALGDALRAIRSRNKDFRDQASDGANALRELHLAIAETAPAQAFAQSLAKAIQMRVVIFSDPVFFTPEFTVSPPSVDKRGVIELSGTKSEDVHTFDGQGTAFDP